MILRFEVWALLFDQKFSELFTRGGTMRQRADGAFDGVRVTIFHLNSPKENAAIVAAFNVNVMAVTIRRMRRARRVRNPYRTRIPAAKRAALCE